MAKTFCFTQYVIVLTSDPRKTCKMDVYWTIAATLGWETLRYGH